MSLAGRRLAGQLTFERAAQDPADQLWRVSFSAEPTSGCSLRRIVAANSVEGIGLDQVAAHAGHRAGYHQLARLQLDGLAGEPRALASRAVAEK